MEFNEVEIDMKELPEGIKESKVLITFPDKKDKDEIPVINWGKLENKASTVNKWVGVLSDVNITDVRKARKKHIESKHIESKHIESKHIENKHIESKHI